MPEPNEFKIENWLQQIAGNVQIPEDKRKVLSEVLGQEAIAKAIKDGFMARPDYSRAMDELKRQRENDAAAIKARSEALVRDFESLAQYRANANTQLQAANQRFETAQQREAKLREALRKVKDNPDVEFSTLGVDDTLLSPMNEPSPAPAPRAAPGTQPGNGQFLTQEELTRILRKQNADFAVYPVELHDISVRHRRLFGNDIEMMPLLEEAERLGKPVLTVWEEKYNPAGKQRELDEAALQVKLQEAEQKGFEKGRQAAVRIPGAPPGAGDMPHSPVFGVSDREPPPAGADQNPAAARASYLEHAAESLLLTRNSKPQPAAA